MDVDRQNSSQNEQDKKPDSKETASPAGLLPENDEHVENQSEPMDVGSGGCDASREKNISKNTESDMDVDDMQSDINVSTVANQNTSVPSVEPQGSDIEPQGSDIATGITTVKDNVPCIAVASPSLTSCHSKENVSNNDVETMSNISSTTNETTSDTISSTLSLPGQGTLQYVTSLNDRTQSTSSVSSIGSLAANNTTTSSLSTTQHIQMNPFSEEDIYEAQFFGLSAETLGDSCK